MKKKKKHKKRKKTTIKPFSRIDNTEGLKPKKRIKSIKTSSRVKRIGEKDDI